jgi:hypothetical protein
VLLAGGELFAESALTDPEQSSEDDGIGKIVDNQHRVNDPTLTNTIAAMSSPFEFDLVIKNGIVVTASARHAYETTMISADVAG